MPFSFTIAKPPDLTATLHKIKTLVEDASGTLTGDTHSGHISCHGIEGTYITSEGEINITVNKKPPIYPERAVREYIRGIAKP